MAAPTTVELLWGTRQRPKRGPKPALSLEAIVAEAIVLADSEGLANLSMQRLAERLGFTKMSLYRYVPGKEQLTALMLDTALGEPPATAEPDPADEAWRAGLRRWARTIFQRYLAHPWTIELATGPRAIGPNELAWMEAALTALHDTGLTGPERLDTIVLLNGHVRGLVQQTRPEPQAQDSGDRAEQIMAQFFAAVGASGDRYPEVLAAFAEEAAAADPSVSSDALTFGIERILDGLGVLIAARV